MKYSQNIGKDRLGEAIKKSIKDGSKISIIASYFTIFAFSELKEELNKIDDFRFIFNQPTFIKKLHNEKEPKEFQISQKKRQLGVSGTGLELTLKNNISQRAIAKQCAQWVKNNVRFKSAKRCNEIQNGSSYIVENSESDAQAFMGADSLPFTLEGLGYEKENNTITGYSHFENSNEASGLITMFNEVWDNDKLLEDVTEKVLEQIETLYRENSPEYLYYLLLYHLFKDYLENEGEETINPKLKFDESKIWNTLYDFQKDAVIGAIRKLEKYKGCIIADSVGLGKTYEALAVIKYFEERNGRVLVLTPKRLRENWTLWTRYNDDRNPLSEDRFSYDVLNHTDLSRYYGKSGEIDLEHLRWGNYDLLVIDESHNFRNRSTDEEKTDRYSRLINDVIKSGIRTKVLMLSATPVNNKLLDLRNQISLITEEDDEYLAETDSISSIKYLTRDAQQQFNKWSKFKEGERTTELFVDMMPPDFFKLLDIFTIARSRKHISKYYSEDNGSFPNRLKPISYKTKIDTLDQLPSITELNDIIRQISFSKYTLFRYILPNKVDKYKSMYEDRWGKDFDSQLNRSFAAANLMRINMLKRLESSVDSFRITLENVLGQFKDLLNKLDDENQTVEMSVVKGFEFDDEEDAYEVEFAKDKNVDLRDLDLIKLKEDLEFDISKFEYLLEQTSKIVPDRDAKLCKLKEYIKSKVENPINPGNNKILIFSAFADTVNYLYENIAEFASEKFSLECAKVTGQQNSVHSTKLSRNSFENILAHFSPISKELPMEEIDKCSIDILFATDCISEGQNLQDCDCVVNYDIHWNPVRIIQRFGRIDRLGSQNADIQLVNFWPDIDLDEYINLENRVKGRMVLLDTTATGEENVLDSKSTQEMNDLQYRKKQLLQLQEEASDIEDISSGISITDFAFDDYRVELQQYCAQTGHDIENSPIGLHAVAGIPACLHEEIKPGVIFCIKQNKNIINKINPIHPYCLIYMSEDGEILVNHTYPKKILDILRAVCNQQNKPFDELASAFNLETKDGLKMDKYTNLLEIAVETIAGIQEEKGINDIFSLGEVGSNVISKFDDYSLIGFVIIKNYEN